jgi:uncharacterized protein YgiM (DUF1202 family)
MSTNQLSTPHTVTRRHVAKGLLTLPVLALGVGVGIVQPASARSGGFTIGDRVIVNTDLLNLRDGPGLGYGVQSALSYGTYLTIQDGPVFADDHAWYKVYDDPEGWVAGGYLTYATSGGGGRFNIGDAVFVNTDWLNLRSGQGLDFSVIDVLPFGTNATIIGIPAGGSNDGYDWFQIETSDGRAGWVAGAFLAAGSGGGGGGLFDIGAEVVVNTDWLNFRDGAGLSAGVIDVLPYGTGAVIAGYPASGTGDGYDWYQIELASGAVGWVAGDFLGLA